MRRLKQLNSADLNYVRLVSNIRRRQSNIRQKFNWYFKCRIFHAPNTMHKLCLFTLSPDFFCTIVAQMSCAESQALCDSLGQWKMMSFLVSARIGFGHAWKIFIIHYFWKKGLAKFGSFALSMYCFRVQQMQLKILVFPKNSPAKPGDHRSVSVSYEVGAFYITRMLINEKKLSPTFRKWLTRNMISTFIGLSANHKSPK